MAAPRFPVSRLRGPMKRATASAHRGLADGATPTPPLRISATAAAGAPLPNGSGHDPRRNTTKLRDMFHSTELGFLMEAHVRGHPRRPAPPPPPRLPG